MWTGREARASANSTIPSSQRSEGMSHAPITQVELEVVGRGGQS
jgi:hypothetical protein